MQGQLGRDKFSGQTHMGGAGMNRMSGGQNDATKQALLEKMKGLQQKQQKPTNDSQESND